MKFHYSSNPFPLLLVIFWAIPGVQFRRLQQVNTDTKFVRLNTARLTNYQENQVDSNCPIFVLCVLNTTRSTVTDRTTCITASVGRVVSEDVWLYSSNEDSIPPFSISLLPSETIQCRFSARINGFIQFYEFEDGAGACTFRFEDFAEKSVQFCRLEDEGDFSLSTQTWDNSDDQINRPGFEFPDVGLDESTLRDGLIIGMIAISFGTAFVIMCRSQLTGRNENFGMSNSQVGQEVERRDTGGSSPTVFEAGSPQSKASSSKKNNKGPIVFLNPSSFTNPKLWFTNRLFMLGEPETYSNPPNSPSQTQQTTGTLEVEMPTINQTSL